MRNTRLLHISFVSFSMFEGLECRFSHLVCEESAMALLHETRDRGTWFCAAGSTTILAAHSRLSLSRSLSISLSLSLSPSLSESS